MAIMLTCTSPRKVMRAAYQLCQQALPAYSCKFSRHDFTLHQLFACLVLKEHQNRTYRGTEALLGDSPGWCRDIGLKRVPDHNALWRAAGLLLKRGRVNRLLDAVAQWAAVQRLLGFSKKPLVIDSTYYESRHVSRHYERRCHQTRRRLRREKGWKTSRSRTVQRLPKLTLAGSAHSHLVLAMDSSTGAGGDHPHFGPLLEQARRRIPHRRLKVAADCGFDSEANHRLARGQQRAQSLIPPEGARPRQDGSPPPTRWRRLMHRLLGSQAGRRRSGYSQRVQSETIHSMMKRNLGAALRGKNAWSRKRDMALKVLTHDVMILQPRVETEPGCPECH